MVWLCGGSICIVITKTYVRICNAYIVDVCFTNSVRVCVSDSEACVCEIVKRVLTASVKATELRHVFATCQHVLCLVCGVNDNTVCVCVRKCGSLCVCVNMFLHVFT